MAERTNISWADATMNFWISCTKVSPACTNCYAETWAHRFGIEWGPHAPRIVTKNWVQKMNKIMRESAKGGIDRPFVFSNSLSDIFDNAVPLEVLGAALDVMRRFPKAVFLLLTKRPQNIVKRITELAKQSLGPYADEEGIRSFFPRNAAIGCTVVNQEEADRDLPRLKRAYEALKPAFAFVSMEPLLEGVDMAEHLRQGFLGWVIAGGESGAHARPSHPKWFRDLRDQCAEAGIPFQQKQNGEWLEQPHLIDASIGDMHHRFSDGTWVARIGKAAAGRELDGVIHDARPEVA